MNYSRADPIPYRIRCERRCFRSSGMGEGVLDIFLYIGQPSRIVLPLVRSVFLATFTDFPQGSFRKPVKTDLVEYLLGLSF